MTDRGCYQSPSTYSPESKVCKGCEAQRACGEKVLQTLTLIRKKVNVEALIERIELNYLGLDAANKLTLAQITTIATVPQRLQGRLKVLLMEGFDLIASARFQRGLNPFKSTGAKHLHLAGQMLLGGGFTKTEFRTECIRRYGWTTSTAFSQVSQALALLRGLSLTQETDNRTEMK